MRRTDCPTPQDLIDFCVGKLADEKIDSVVAHLDRCPACEKVVEGIERVPIPFISYHLSDTSHGGNSYALDPRFHELLDELKRLNPDTAT